MNSDSFLYTPNFALMLAASIIILIILIVVFASTHSWNNNFNGNDVSKLKVLSLAHSEDITNLDKNMRNLCAQVDDNTKSIQDLYTKVK